MHPTIWSARIRVANPEQLDSAVAALWQLSTLGIEESEGSLLAYFDQSLSMADLHRHFGDDVYDFKESIEPVSTEESADREPILVGKRFVIVPDDRIVLRMNAAMAFGSGRHETTQLCLESLERHVKPSAVVLDVGCGSGILAHAAQQLGALRVVAADFDEDAIAVARRHFSGKLILGSADCLASATADLILCNITPKILDALAFDLKRILKPNGVLILSGFTHENPPRNFRPQTVTFKNDWQCWLCCSDGIVPAAHDSSASVDLRSWWEQF